MNNFSAKLVGIASLFSFVSAQLPRECFFVTDRHGVERQNTNLLSDLPLLLQNYKPSMYLNSIVSLEDPHSNNRLVGMQVNLKDHKGGEDLELPMIGQLDDQWTPEMTYFSERPELITLMIDENIGVCDVILSIGEQQLNLSTNAFDCTTNNDSVTDLKIRLPEETPLVGFHGKVDEKGIASLGLILLETSDPICKQPSEKPDMTIYAGLSETQKAKLVESGITKDEKARAQALEAILLLDSVFKARQNRDAIMAQLLDLDAMIPIRIHNNKPASVQDLKNLLDRLAGYTAESKSVTRSELKEMFTELTEHYSGDNASEYVHEKLPITVKDIKSVYQHLAMINGSRGSSHFKNRSDNADATIADLVLLFDQLSQHYATGPGTLDNMDVNVLIHLFSTMSDYYSLGEGKDIYGASDLLIIYDHMAQIFGNASEFKLDDEQVQIIYEQMVSEQPAATLDDTELIHSFQELLDQEEYYQDQQRQQLLDQLVEQGRIEQENKEKLENNLHQVDEELKEAIKSIPTDTSDTTALQNLIKQVQLEAQNSQLMEEGQLVNLERTINKISEQIDNMPLQPAQAANINISSTAIQEMQTETTNQIEQAKTESKEEVQQMFNIFVAISLAALFVGLAFGALCIYCIGQKRSGDYDPVSNNVLVSPEQVEAIKGLVHQSSSFGLLQQQRTSSVDTELGMTNLSKQHTVLLPQSSIVSPDIVRNKHAIKKPKVNVSLKNNNNILKLNKIDESPGVEGTDSSEDNTPSQDDQDKKETLQTTEQTLNEEEDETVLQKDGSGVTDLLGLNSDQPIVKKEGRRATFAHRNVSSLNDHNVQIQKMMKGGSGDNIRYI